jgi:hypothetical protein
MIAPLRLLARFSVDDRRSEHGRDHRLERDIGAARGTRIGAVAGARALGCTLVRARSGPAGNPTAASQRSASSSTPGRSWPSADGWAFRPGSAGDYLALTMQALKADAGG